jgi:ubiquinone/menaquinone biosynthesis C-methylase UbiE
MTGAADSTKRFSNRVADYVRYRPGYPAGVLNLLREECGLTRESVVADVGSGTGILTRLFLENGNFVYGVEPNAEMRAAGEEFLAAYSKFRSVAAPAEATSLPDASVDLVTAAQAFHWFDPQAARAEFARILRPGRWVAVIWNERKKSLGPFAEEYETLLRTYGTDYARVSETYPEPERMAQFFGAGNFQHRAFANEQRMDFEALRGRLLSSSYAPLAGHAKHEPMLTELRRVFDRHAENERVRFEYDTHVYFGQLHPNR